MTLEDSVVALRLPVLERAHPGWRLRGKAPAQEFFWVHERKDV